MSYKERMTDFLERVCFDRDLDYMDDPRDPMKYRLDEAKKMYKEFCEKENVEPNEIVLTL